MNPRPAPRAADAQWDAGDLGCGDLVLELRRRMEAMRPGQLLRLTAIDPGARADIPAWCRMTGHTLIAEEHPVYLIRRKEN
ncbi:MAG TPA: sulfurtransferase TusA family protein [Methylomirabilota bacterium]|jgi:tRNA 2-thiouridine synthesizing protein A